MPTLDERTALWVQILEEVRKRLTQGQFDTWFRRTGCESFTEDTLSVGVPNRFFLEWLRRQYSTAIRAAAETVLGRPLAKLDFVITESVDEAPPELFEAVEAAQAPEAPTVARSEPLVRRETELPGRRGGLRAGSLHLNADYIFENFVVGASNRLAHAASMAVVESNGRVYNPLFIHGGLGLGKTHLLQAACHALLTKRPSTRMAYIPCEQFINQFIAALERNRVEPFRQRYRDLDVLVIDDIHFLANKEHTQEEFFHTFNALYNDQKQIIISSDSAPKDIPTLEERLVSRFKWGLVCEIEAPTFETRMTIVRKKAGVFGVEMPDDVTEYLAESLRTSIREMEGAVTRLIGFASIMKCPINLETAKTALGDIVDTGKKRVTIDQIIEMVTEHYGVRLAELQSKKRNQSITLPRQVCMYLARTFTTHSLAEIGGYFGGRDHSTVLYATERVTKRMKTDPDLRSAVGAFTRRIES